MDIDNAGFHERYRRTKLEWLGRWPWFVRTLSIIPGGKPDNVLLEIHAHKSLVKSGKNTAYLNQELLRNMQIISLFFTRPQLLMVDHLLICITGWRNHRKFARCQVFSLK